MVVNVDKGESRQKEEAAAAGRFLPTGPLIPVDQIPNELRRLFASKKVPPPAPPLPVVQPDEVKSLTLLAQVALVVFISVCLFLLLLLLLFCCVQLRRCYRRRHHRAADKMGDRSFAAPVAEEVFHHEPVFRTCSVKSRATAGEPAVAATAPSTISSRSSFGEEDSPRQHELVYELKQTLAPRIQVTADDDPWTRPAADLSLNRSMASCSFYEEVAERNRECSQSSSSSFDDYPDVPAEVVSGHVTRF
jgi:hypothetical protein